MTAEVYILQKLPARAGAKPPLPTQTRIRGDETEDFHPSWTTNSLTGKKEHGVMMVRNEGTKAGFCALSTKTDRI